ncbi:MAG: hypothetical protein ACTSU5_07120, partial [Promethearchaeota archaeon]
QSPAAQAPYTPTFATLPGAQAPEPSPAGSGVPPMPEPPGTSQQAQSPAAQAPYTPTFATLPGAQAPTLTGEPPAPLKEGTVGEFQERREREKEIQDSAFELLDQGARLTKAGDLDGAISAYTGAINLLNEIGWTEETSRILDLVQSLYRRKETPGVMGEEAAIASPLLGVPAVVAFRERRDREVEVQDEAFKVLDEANQHIRRKEVSEARAKYRRAIDLLNSIGWYEQTKHIYATLERLEEGEKSALKAEMAATPDAAAASPFGEVENAALRERLELEFRKRRESVKEFEARKAKEEAIQEDAFKLIDEGYDLVSKNDVEGGLKAFNRAISLLNSIGWQDHTSRLQEIVIKLVEDKKREDLRAQQARIQAIQTAREAAALQDLLGEKAREQEALIAAKKASEAEKRALKERTEKLRASAFALITRAESLRSGPGRNYEDALSLYRQASTQLTEAGWVEQAERVKGIIDDVQREAAEHQRELARLEQRRLEEQRVQEEFQAQLRSYMEQEAKARAEARERLLQFEARRRQLQDLESEAMAYTNKATELVKRRQYLEAITLYNTAIQRFQQAGWLQQVPYLQQEVEKCRVLQAQMDEAEAIAAQERLREQLAERKRKEEEERREQEVKGTLADLKGMLAKAAIEQEKKQLEQELGEKEKFERYLESRKKEVEKKSAMESLRAEIRRKVEEEAALKHKKREEEEAKKARETRDEIASMLRELGGKSGDS